MLQDLHWDFVWAGNNALWVAFSEDDIPFMALVYDPKIFKGISISFSVELTDAFMAADLTARFMTICPTEVAEEFYVDEDKNLYFGEDARIMYELVDNKELLNMKVEGLYVH